jgi:hypothetical protein
MDSWVVLIWVASMVVGALIGHARADVFRGVVVPFFLGPLGVLLVALFVSDKHELA